jgi:hypothetical protein
MSQEDDDAPFVERMNYPEYGNDEGELCYVVCMPFYFILFQ